MKTWARFFCVFGSFQVYFTDLVPRKQAFLHHLWSEENYQVLLVCHSDHRIYVIFLPHLSCYFVVFHRIILQVQIALIQVQAEGQIFGSLVEGHDRACG